MQQSIFPITRLFIEPVPQLSQKGIPVLTHGLINVTAKRIMLSHNGSIPLFAVSVLLPDIVQELWNRALMLPLE